MNSYISKVSYFLPQRILDNKDINNVYTDWQFDKISSKTGIYSRHIADENEFSLELAEKASNKLFEEFKIDKLSIDYIIFCSQTPKYLVPSSSCILQHKLGLSSNIGAIDINLGCSGYIYSLGVASSLICAKQAQKVLLITSDTYTKLVNNENKQLRNIFGDGAAASLIENNDNVNSKIIDFSYQTNGAGADCLISGRSGLFGLSSGKKYTQDLEMKGPDIFKFTLEELPILINKILSNNNITKDKIKYCIFHQANQFMLECIRDKIGFSKEQFIIDLKDTGNTISSSIPIILSNLFAKNILQSNDYILLVGFGVGLSSAACLMQI